ncbi:hypothetical protein N7490_002005 [Penicillium lividum]|nr:hypothetical protein N7490_002005 [Penicillium lividum]
MNGTEHIVRELGRQRARNAYYRDCYALFKLLQDLTEQTSNELKSIYTSDGDRPAYAVHQIVWQFQNQVSSLIEQACEAQATCEGAVPGRPHLLRSGGVGTYQTTVQRCKCSKSDGG